MNGQTHSENYYRVFDITTAPVGQGKVLVHFRRLGKFRLFAPSELELLLFCQTFDTLTSHAEQYCQQRKLEQLSKRKGLLGKLFRFLLENREQYVREIPVLKKEMEPFHIQLQKWVVDGFLVSESELRQEVSILAQNNHQPESESNDTITVMGIPTCGRPEILKRCLNSFIDNFNRHNRAPELLILDDSRSEKEQQKNQRVLQELQDRYPGKLYSMDRRQRAAFAQAVARKAGVDPEVMEFAFMGHPACDRSEGGCRNAFLLLTRGRLALQTDDDTICRTARPPDAGNGLTLTSASSSDDYWFYSSFEEALNAVECLDTDFLKLHEQMIGKVPGELIAPFLDSGNGLDLGRMQSSFLQNMGSGQARIRMSLVGPVGDTCLNNDLHRLFLEGDSFHRLISPANEYSQHLTTRQVIRCVSGPTISDFPRCIGMNFAVDNRVLLPPFMPVQARCDGIFGDLLAVCFPGVYAGNLPYVLAHDPPEPRTRTVEEVFSLLECVRVNDLIAVLIHSSQKLTIYRRSGRKPPVPGAVFDEPGKLSEG